MGKVSGCKTCETMRCCPDHCCNWDGCTCGDCELCGGFLSFEYTQKEIQDMENEKKELELRKKEEEEMEIKRKEEEILQRKLAEEKLKEEGRLKKEQEEKKTKNIEEEIDKKLSKDENYLKTMAMIDETQRKNQEVINNIGSTLEKLGNTLQGVKETTDAMDNFKNEFDKIMHKMIEKLSGKVGPLHMRPPQNGDLQMTPEISDVQSIAQEIMSFSHIVILTGAGVSVESNIPSFRGEGGFWTLRDAEKPIKASEFLTYEFFRDNPKEVWRWHHELRRLVAKNAPGLSHQAIADLQAFCHKSNIKFTLITQNIDGYHVESYNKASTLHEDSDLKTRIDQEKKETKEKENGLKVSGKAWKADDVEERKLSDLVTEQANKFGFCDRAYEIHGNINYMRCANNCSYKLYPSPEVGCSDDYVPKCPGCKGIARPHTLFFDEQYLEHFYRQQSLLNEIQSMDCLIVIGTALETTLAANIVALAIANKKLIVEINPNPCIKCGKVRQLIGDAKEIVPSLCYSIEDKIIEERKTRK